MANRREQGDLTDWKGSNGRVLEDVKSKDSGSNYVGPYRL